MSEINRIPSGNAVIPPVPQDKAVDEREKKKQRDDKKEEQTDDTSDNKDEKNMDGIDYYA